MSGPARLVVFGEAVTRLPAGGARPLALGARRGPTSGVAAPEGIRAMRAVAPAAQVLFTRGTDGMRLLGEAQEVDRLVYPGSGVDMVGARDACVGAWMASLLTRPGASPTDHVSWAAAAATVSCAHVGACAPTREEVDSVCAGTSSPRAGAASR